MSDRGDFRNEATLKIAISMFDRGHDENSDMMFEPLSGPPIFADC